MSGLKPQPLTEFYRSLAARGLTTDIMAAMLGVSGSTLRKKIGGLSARRGPVWTGFLDLLTEKEIQLWRDVEQCSAWNIRQSAKRPRWTFEKAAQLAMSTAA